MTTTTIKTEELTGAALDWATFFAQHGHAPVIMSGKVFEDDGWKHTAYSPSTYWAIAGPIIDRENIGISPPTSRVHRNGGNSPGWGPSGYWSATTWHAGVNGRRSIMLHETSVLIAAMRCFVHSKLGESAKIPEELSH